MIFKEDGMTLIELILLMAMLAMVMTLSVPTLSYFVTGRSLQEESRKFLSLTRYGRSQAISCSVPMKLWIDTETGEYGLKSMGGYECDDCEKIDWTLKEKLSFSIEENNLKEEPEILFLPDGSIDEESLKELSIKDNKDKAILIKQTDYGLGYEIEKSVILRE